MKHIKPFLISTFLLILSGCQTLDTISNPFFKTTEPPLMERTQKANQLAQTVNYTKRIIETGQFEIVTYGTLKAPDKPAHIYIEGDGLTYFNDAPALNPTPVNPVGLALATADNFDNVIYFAKPCQFTEVKAPCSAKYWTTHRYAPEIVNAIHQSLNYIKTQYGIETFHLFGYGGGATIASVLAAKRDDILSLRTVAGNLDHIGYAIENDRPLMPQSLNAADFAQGLEDIPQVHFSGAQDTVIPVAIFESFKKRMDNTQCVRHEVIENTGHSDGWARRWPALLVMKPFCKK